MSPGFLKQSLQMKPHWTDLNFLGSLASLCCLASIPSQRPPLHSLLVFLQGGTLLCSSITASSWSRREESAPPTLKPVFLFISVPKAALSYPHCDKAASTSVSFCFLSTSPILSYGLKNRNDHFSPFLSLSTPRICTNLACMPSIKSCGSVMGILSGYQAHWYYLSTLSNCLLIYDLDDWLLHSWNKMFF